MQHLQGTYVHRGDGLRRRTRLKQTVLALSFFSALGFLLGNREPVAANAEAAPVSRRGAFRLDVSTDRTLTAQLDSARGELELAQTQLDRANKIIGFSTQYGINAQLAGNIVDVARAEGIDPELAFRLVKLESDFNVHATSPVGAVRAEHDRRLAEDRPLFRGLSRRAPVRRQIRRLESGRAQGARRFPAQGDL